MNAASINAASMNAASMNAAGMNAAGMNAVVHLATRRSSLASVSLLVWLLVATQASDLLAQQSTVQLPRLSQFRTTGSFFVPDSGATFSAGVSRSGLGTRNFGIAPLPGLGQRSTGGNFNRTGASTQVQVYSLREMEAALLESAPANPAKPRPVANWTPPASAPAQALEFNRRLRYSHQPPNSRR